MEPPPQDELPHREHDIRLLCAIASARAGMSAEAMCLSPSTSSNSNSDSPLSTTSQSSSQEVCAWNLKFVDFPDVGVVPLIEACRCAWGIHRCQGEMCRLTPELQQVTHASTVVR
jgi:hypothetical protein